MNKLPYECTCKVSERTKVKRFLEAGTRELELCLAIMKGYRPKLRVGDRVYKVKEIKRDGTLFKLSFPVLSSLDLGRHKTFILLDRHGKPLYRYTLKKLKVKLGAVKTLQIIFNLGMAST